MVCKVRIFYISFVLLSIGTNVLRLLIPDFKNNHQQKYITLIYTPLQVICFLIEIYVVYFFYDTCINFALIL